MHTKLLPTNHIRAGNLISVQVTFTCSLFPCEPHHTKQQLEPDGHETRQTHKNVVFLHNKHFRQCFNRRFQCKRPHLIGILLHLQRCVQRENSISINTNNLCKHSISAVYQCTHGGHESVEIVKLVFPETEIMSHTVRV